MGTTLTGTTPATTYDSLIKVTDNGPLSGTAKYLSDGLGNDSALALSTSKVGIGTSVANRLLTIKNSVDGVNGISFQSHADTSEIAYIRYEQTNDILDIFNTSAYASGGIKFSTNSTERMRITSAGNVGIGTSSPTEKLDVNGAVAFRGATASFASASAVGMIDQPTSGITRMLSFGPDVSTLGSFQFYITGANNTGGVSPMTITNTGNVGIGTSAPFYKQQVNTSSTGNIVSAGFVNTSSANNTTKGSSISLLLSDTVGNLKDAAYLRGYAGDANVLTGGLAIDVRKVDGTPTEIARFTPDGLTFNGDTAAANALDDYEEGTWTMSVSFGGGDTGITYLARTGNYTKIGRQVTVSGYLALASKGSSTGDAQITGLPFTIGNSLANYSVPSLWLDDITFANVYSGYGVVNDTKLELYEFSEAGVFSSLTNADFADTSRIMISFTYSV